MSKLEDFLEEVEEKIHQLGKQKSDALEELASARKREDGLKAEIANLKAQIKDLTDKNKVMTVAKTLNSEEDSADARKRINEMVREIDKCIAQINR